MPKKGENIYKRKDGRWEGRYIKFYDQAGKAKYGYIYGPTYGDVKKKLLSAKSTSSIAVCQSNQTTYCQIIDNWLAVIRINTKESTFARYHHLINTHIVPYLGHYRMEEFTNQLLERYVSYLITSGRRDGKGGLSNKTVSDILVLVKRSFEYAIDNGQRVNCKANKICVKSTLPEMRVFSKEEQNRLQTYLTTNMDSVKFGILISLYTGIRIGELCALKWEQLDLTNQMLAVRKTMIRIQNVSGDKSSRTKLVVSEPKSKCSIRDIPIPSFITALAPQFINSSSSFVLTGDIDKAIEPRTLQYRFHKYIKECGIDDANFHALRHTFATRCVEVGFEIKSLSEVLGHSNVNITLNRYVHPSMELKRTNMQKLDAIVNF